MAFAHHDATHGDQRRGGKSVFFRAKKSPNGYVAAGLQFAVNLQAHTAAQIVQHQDLLHVSGKSERPRERPRAGSN